MTRITHNLALLIALVTLAVVAPAAASAANAPNSGGVPGSVLNSGGVPGTVKPAAKAKVVRPNPTCQGTSCNPYGF